jgi:purine-cytosine permease-like protein
MSGMPDKTLDEAKSIEAIDVFGKVETRGVDFIPEKERHSKPQELAWVFFGAQITYGSLLIGALPVAFGLNWLQALTAIVVGTVLGSLALGAMAWLGPRTGTNGTVSSSAFFGIRGRYVGSFISQTIDLGYFAMTLWFSVPPILEGLNMLFGWPTTGPIVTVALVIVALVILAFGIFGHATIVAYEKFTAIAGLVCMLMLTYFTISHWHPPATPPALLLGSFWPTWAIGVTVTIANAISYSPYASDYSRYMPTASKPKILFGWSLFGDDCRLHRRARLR